MKEAPKSPEGTLNSGVLARIATLPQAAVKTLINACRERPLLAAVLLAAACGGGGKAAVGAEALGCPLPQEVIADGGRSESDSSDGGAPDGGNLNRLAGVEPRVEAGAPTGLTPGPETNNGLDYRVAFNVPPFDPRTVPGFEQTCSAWPLVVKVRSHLVRNPSNQVDGDSPDEVTVDLGEKEIWGFGPDFVDFRILRNYDSKTSYVIVLLTPDGQEITASQSVAVDSFGSNRLATPEPDAGL